VPNIELVSDAVEGVVFIGVAQEKASSFKCRKKTGPQGRHGGTSFNFSRQLVCVNQYYFYLQDQQWGSGLHQGRHLPALPGARLSQRRCAPRGAIESERR
jgi:hypothetical protein